MNKLASVLTEAIKDFEEYGFDSEARLHRWLELIRQVIDIRSNNIGRLDAVVRDQLRALFNRLVTKETILKDHPGVPQFALKNVANRLRAELDRRIMASANQIVLNRQEMVALTMKRFSGWATSVPTGGTETLKKSEVKKHISTPFQSLPFIERRVLIDQGHKLNASISSVLAQDNGAIAASWFSHFRQAGYNYREDHKERDGRTFIIRGSWADKEGLVKRNDNGYTDQIDQPCEKPFCRCKWIYYYHLRQLPEEMLTAKGKDSLMKARGQ